MSKLSRLLTATASIAGLASVPVGISVAEVHKLNKDSIFDFEVNSNLGHTGEEIIAGVNSYLKEVTNSDNYTAVAGSLFPIDETGFRFRVAVKRNTVSLAYNDENLKDKHVISANVFKDASDDLWRLVGEGDNRRLVQISEEDQTEILKRAYNPNLKRALASVYKELPCEAGDFVAYYNEDTASVEFGLAASYNDKNKTIGVVSKDKKELVTAPSVAILASTNAVDFRTTSLEATASDALQQYINYLRSYYGENNALIEGFQSFLTSKRRG